MKTNSTLALALLASAAFAATASAQTPQQQNAQESVKDKVQDAVRTVTGNPLANADTDMKHVIDALGSLNPKDISKVSAAEARQQPGAADAAMKVLRDTGHATTPDPTVKAKNILVDGGAGKIVATVFSPAAATGALPVIVFYHGGGWVIANNASYASSATMLAKNVDAVVVEVEYSKAPEHKFPAAHDDAIAAYKWVLANAASIGGDPKKVAVAGESAGGNLAVNVAIAARDQKLQAPVHMLVVYPVAGVDTNTQSYKDNSDAKPLNKPMMEWFIQNVTKSPADLQDARLDLVGKADLKGLPSSTLITDQIDPLQTEGMMLADKLKSAGNKVDAKNYDGATHEFFGMAMVVGKAKQANDVAVADLKAAFGASAP